MRTDLNVSFSLTTKDWKKIAEYVPGRTDSQCLYKWKHRTKIKAFTKSSWTNREDEVLVMVVNQFGAKNWQNIANIFNREIRQPNARTGKQCRERWLNHLHPSINKGPWTIHEDLVLLENHKTFQNQWSKIAKYLPGRTENMVKNRFNILAKKNEQSKVKNKSIRGLEDTNNTAEFVDEEFTWRDDMIQKLKNTKRNHPMINIKQYNTPKMDIMYNRVEKEKKVYKTETKPVKVSTKSYDTFPVGKIDLSKVRLYI